MPLELTATGRYFRVYKNGIAVSQHTTEREAIQRVTEVFEAAYEAGEPVPDVIYRHEYEVRADMSFLRVSGAGTVPTPDPPAAGSNEARIDAILDTVTIPARFTAVEYPNDPVTTATDNVTNQTELNTALAAGNGRLINVAAGSYTSITINAGQSDLDLVLADTASFSGGVTINGSGGAVTRIRVTGGDINEASTYALVIMESGVSHVMIDNVNFAEGGHLSNFNGAPNHIAIINTTFDSPGAQYGLLYGGINHLIVANCNASNDDGTVAGIRGTGTNLIFAKSRIFSSGNRIWRLHAEGNDNSDLVLVTGCQLESDSDHNLWISPEAGVDTTGRITRVEFRNNNYYAVSSGTSGAVLQCDSSTNETSSGANDGVDDVIADGNTFNSPDTAPMTGNAPATWSETNSTYNTYSSPPAYSGGADH